MENTSTIKLQKKKKNPNMKFIVSMLAYPVFYLVILSAFVQLMTFSMSLFRYDQFGNMYYNGFGNYIEIFDQIAHGEGIGLALLNSLSFMPISLFIKTPICIVFAYFLYKKIWFYKTFRVIYFFPSLVSIVIMIMAFRYMVNDEFGLVTNLVKAIGLGGIIPENGWFGTHWSSYVMVWIYQLWVGVGHTLVIVQGSMLRIPKSVIESGQLDGVSIFREFFQIVIPLIFGNIATLILFSVTGVFNEFITVQLMIGDNPGDKATLALHIVNQTKSGDNNSQAGAAALGVMLTLVSAPIVLVLRYLLNKITPDVQY